MFEAGLMCLDAGMSPRWFCSLAGLAGFGKFYYGYAKNTSMFVLSFSLRRRLR